MLLVSEDNDTRNVAPNPLGAYLDARARGDVAMNQHRTFFESDAHLDRLDAVTAILKNFFGRNPDYFTPRGVNRNKPFENVKMADVGRFLSRHSVDVKNERLYKPLMALGDIDVKSTNGHLIVRVYPKKVTT